MFSKYWSNHSLRDFPRVPFAFGIPIIHWILQVTLPIAVCCVLHRVANQDIHHWSLRHVAVSSKKRILNKPNQPKHGLGVLRTSSRMRAQWLCVALLMCNSHNIIGLVRVNDPSAGSPTETLLRLLLPLSDKVYKTSHGISRTTNTTIQIIHRITQSVGATGGVYKGQGRNQHKLMTCAY